MFNREKYNKKTQNMSHTAISKNIISSNKYLQRTYQKAKKQIVKKNGCNCLCKKNISYIYWIDKENDKNNQNYNYNKKFHYENKRKSFRYQKKLSYSEFDNDSLIKDFKEENKKNENEKNLNIKKDEYDSKEDVYKDEKHNSIEYTISTAYSNSISTHEEYNSNTINLNENLNNEEFKLNSKDSNLSDNINYYVFSIEQNQFVPKNKLNEENEIKNIDINDRVNDINNMNNHYISNSTKNLCFIGLNPCPNRNNEITSFSSNQVPKVKNINKHSENNSIEPFNKYNSINQDLNQFWFNPIAENTEILNVNVKISKNKSAIFKLRRFDDLFLTVKLFCEINSIDEKLMKPIIIKSLCALNNIYQVFNTQIDDNNLKRLRFINTFINKTYL